MVTGSGTSADPYVLYNLSDLEQISVLGLNKYYELANDIDASATADPSYNGGAGWLPIATGSLFTGNFDGKGYSITSLYINRPTTDNIGLFSKMHHDGNTTLGVWNLNILNCNITGRNNVAALSGTEGKHFHNINVTGSITGVGYVGGVLGFSNIASFYDAYVLEVDDCTFTGTITASGDRVGGIIGGCPAYRVHASITNCFVDADITGVGYVGGIVGIYDYNSQTQTREVFINDHFTGTITASGTYSGGIVGWGHSIFDGCTVDAEITTTSSFSGGIVGYFNSHGAISNSSFTGSIDGFQYVGGIIGATRDTNASCPVEDCSVDADLTGTEYVGGICGRQTLSNALTSCVNCTIKGSITASGSYVGGVYGRGTSLIQGITIDESLTINTSATSSYVGGIMGYCANSFTMIGCNVSIPLSGLDYVGGIVGGIRDWGNACTVNACSYIGTVTGRNYVGGFYGSNGANLTTNLTSECYSLGTVNATGTNVGGFVGWCYSPISNCYSRSNVTGGTNVGGFGGYMKTRQLTNVYSTGSVSGSIGLGGLVGVQGSLPNNDCFWDLDTSGLATSAIGTGKTTSEMKTQSTFTNWDFETIWGIGSINDGYPVLLHFLLIQNITILTSLDVGFKFGCGQ